MPLTIENQQAVSNTLRELRIWCEEDFGDISTLTKVSYDQNFEQWLIGKIEEESRLCGEEFIRGSFMWYGAGRLKKQIAFHFDIERFEKSLSMNWEFSRYGKVVLEDWKLASFYLHYDAEKIRFHVLIRADLNCYLGPIDSESLKDCLLVGTYNYYEWTELTEVPLLILRSWMKGRQNNPEEGASLLSVDGYNLRYPEGVYPISLSRLFRSLGKNAFDAMLDLNYVEPEAYEIIIEKLQELSSLFDFDLPVQQEARPQQPSSGAATQQQPDRYRISQATIDSLKVSGKDKQKLALIAGVQDYLSYSEWARLLGFGGKGAAFSFLQRLENGGMITLEKTDNGIKVRLTERGKGVLRSSI